MKIFKTTAIISGILVTLSLQVCAASADKKADQKHSVAVEAFGFGRTVEQQLIENYLAEQRQQEQPQQAQTIIYNRVDEVVFEGDSSEAAGLIRKADFLMEFEDALYYRISE